MTRHFLFIIFVQLQGIDSLGSHLLILSPFRILRIHSIQQNGTKMNLPESQPFVEFVMLADRSESINGKLYVMGGAWDRLFLTETPKPYSLYIAVSIVVPWSATNEEHRLGVMIVDADATEVARAQINFTPGTPPQIRRTESQKVLVSAGITPTFQAPGAYRVTATVDDNPETARDTVFYVNLKQGPQAS